MSAEELKRDQNHVTVLGGVTDDSNEYVTMLRVDPTSKRLLVSAVGGPPGSGTVTSVSIATANGISGTVATATSTPEITLTLGAITPITVNGVTFIGASTPVLTITGTASVSGTNTGDQTLPDVSGLVTGAASSTDNAIARFDGITGKIVQNSTITIGDSGAIASTIADTSNVVGLTLTGADSTNNPKLVLLTNASTAQAIDIDQNGQTGFSEIISGAITVNNTDNGGVGMQIYSNHASSTSPLLYLVAKNTGFNKEVIRIIQNGTSGSAAAIRIDGPSPQIEFVETDQVAPAGKFEMQVQGDILFFNGRASTDSNFENAVWILRPDTSAGMNGNVGIGVNPFGIEKLTIGATTGGSPRIALAETTAPTADAGYGKVYVKSSDSLLYFMSGGGTEYPVISSITWTEVTGTTQAIAVNKGYVLNNAGLVTATLPATASVGNVVRIAGKGAGGWKVAQNASQVIHFGDTDTTTGTGGYLASSNRYDAVELLCTTANTDWVVLSTQGNITIV